MQVTIHIIYKDDDDDDEAIWKLCIMLNGITFLFYSHSFDALVFVSGPKSYFLTILSDYCIVVSGYW